MFRQKGRNKMAEKYGLVIIGGGPAGYEAALDAAKKGIKTALVEKRELGGTCLNRGCIPTKTLLHSAELFAEMKKSEVFGITAEDPSYHMEKIQSRKNEVLDQLRSGIEMLMKKNKIAIYNGMGTIVNPNEVQIKGQEETCTIEGEHILIATGSVPSVPPIPGAELPEVHTSDSLLDNTKLYRSLTIIGGGVIGMEFASVYNALGVQVTVIEFLDRILANMDKEISQNLKMIMKKRGVEIHTSAGVDRILERDGSLVCCYQEKEKSMEAVSDAVLIATGRRANTEGLFAPGMEVSMEKGRILVNELGQTSVPNIFAAGDVTPSVQLAHGATANARNITAYLAWEKDGDKEKPFVKPYRADLIPGCVYTNPEIGTIGLTQEEAKALGEPVIVQKYPMSSNGKTVLSGQDRGFIKVIALEKSRRIVGAQMMCARATDMISQFELAIVNGLTLEQMAAVVYPHPTYSEAIGEAVSVSR